MGVLKASQVDAVIIAERVTASISVTCTLVLIATFVFMKRFRTIGNTLLFCASFANVFANIAALIGGSGFSQANGALCQFQGFLLEWFMMSDPLWSCAMSINVFLVFYFHYTEEELKKMLWKYILICYGLPFIPAVFCLIYKTKAKGRMYGDATLWCWIDNDWGFIRIYSYYVPIWASIAVSLIIYVLVGMKICKSRKNLRRARAENHGALKYFDNSGNGSLFTGLRTTEVCVMAIDCPAPTYQNRSSRDPYSVTISSNIHPSTYGHVKPSIFGDKVQMAYLKIAILFAIAVIITWVPSSSNRIYGLFHSTNPSFALNMASALVLPLQGFWNTIIFFTTSKNICKATLHTWMSNHKSNKGQRRNFRLRNMLAGDSVVELKKQRTRGFSGDGFSGIGSPHKFISDSESF